jgi:MFS family permease
MNKFKSVLNITSGNFFEMYDFMVYGIYASIIAETFFPNNNKFLSIMMSLGVFGAGFLMRPLGAIIIGAYIDKNGRKKGLSLTLALMAIGMLMITFTPGYTTIGIFAPILVLAGRLIQGISAGVELGGVSVYLAEIATPGRRGFYVSWQSASQQLAVVFAAAIGYILTKFLNHEQMVNYGWRIPFLIGCLIVPIVFYQRKNLSETEEFKERKVQLSMLQIIQSAISSWRLILLGSTLVMFTTVMFYMITAYTPTYGKTILHLSNNTAFMVTLCVGLSNFILLPIMGVVSDKIGRVKPLLFFSILGIICVYPLLYWLVLSPSFERFLLVQLCFSFIYAGYNGSMVVALTELVDKSTRTIGFALAYSLATAIYGGFTPIIATSLIHLSNNNAMPGLWISIAAICSCIAVLMMAKRNLKNY